MAGHVLPLKTYYSIFGLLLALTGLTVAVAYVDLGALNIFAALGIAAVKATVVILYFMHVKYASKLTQLFVALGFCWLAILLGITSMDFASRAWISEPAGWAVQHGEIGR